MNIFQLIIVKHFDWKYQSSVSLWIFVPYKWFVFRCIINFPSCEKNFGHWLQEYDGFLHVFVFRCIINLPSCEKNFVHLLQDMMVSYMHLFLLVRKTLDIDYKNMMVSYMYLFLDVFLICHLVRKTLDIDYKNIMFSYMYVFSDVFLICHLVRISLDIDYKNMADNISV